MSSRVGSAASGSVCLSRALNLGPTGVTSLTSLALVALECDYHSGQDCITSHWVGGTYMAELMYLFTWREQ